MTQDGFITLLVAEDNAVSREMLSGTLRAQGWKVYGAVDGESAIKVVEDRDIDLALIDINMAPVGGLEFVKHLIVRGLKIPVVIVTADDSSHILREATGLGVAQVIQKPIQPDRLVATVRRLLKARLVNPQAGAAATVIATRFSPDELMSKAIALAEENARARRGGPYGAVIADADGRIVGEGVNGAGSRFDPTAHAEVMAIRQAADKLGSADLSGCTLYCAAMPTAMGQALIASVGIRTVHYGLKDSDVRAIPQAAQPPAQYIETARDAALTVFRAWQGENKKRG